MLTADGPKVLEFNVRFGDPETQAVLPLLGSDLLDLMDATVRGSLSRRRLRWSGASVTVVLASEGYPGSPRAGRTISGLESETPPDVVLFHAGIKSEQGVWKTAGGRVLGVTATGDCVAEAREKAYAAARSIRFSGMQYRKDIGASAVRVP
jgi:phosphoribosylamine--glycine ligase